MTRPDIRAEGTLDRLRVARHPPRFLALAPAQFVLRAEFLAATGVLLVVWLAAA